MFNLNPAWLFFLGRSSSSSSESSITPPSATTATIATFIQI